MFLTINPKEIIRFVTLGHVFLQNTSHTRLTFDLQDQDENTSKIYKRWCRICDFNEMKRKLLGRVYGWIKETR